MKIWIGCFSLSFLVSAWGDPLTDGLNRALTDNPETVAARQAWEAAKQVPRMERSLPDPMVGVDFMRMDSTGFDDVDETEFMVSQTFPWPGKRRARVTAAQHEADAQGFRYLETIRKVRARLTAAYWDLWAAQRRIELARDHLARLNQFEQVARARQEAGSGQQADVLKAQVEAAKGQNEIERLHNDWEVAQAAVRRLMNDTSGTPLGLDTPPPLPALRWTEGDARHGARLYRCILMAYVHEEKAAIARVREARLANAPDLEFRIAARQQRGRNTINEYNTGIAINIPWLWRGKIQGGTRAAEAEQERARARFDDKVNETLFEVRDAYARADSARRTMALFESVVLPRTRELIASTAAAYEEGHAGFLDWIDAQRTWLDAEWMWERARADFAGAVALLDANVAPWMDYEMETGLISEEMRSHHER